MEEFIVRIPECRQLNENLMLNLKIIAETVDETEKNRAVIRQALGNDADAILRSVGKIHSLLESTLKSLDEIEKFTTAYIKEVGEVTVILNS